MTEIYRNLKGSETFWRFNFPEAEKQSDPDRLLFQWCSWRRGDKSYHVIHVNMLEN